MFIDNFFLNTILNNISKTLLLSHRTSIILGFKCSLKCGFCYYKHKWNNNFFNFDYICKLIDFAYAYGIRIFELTGGEPSEYEKLRLVCEYIKLKDKLNKISIITNGYLYKSNVWDLIDEVLVSYHLGNKTLLFNTYIFPNGSTYNIVKNVIDIANKYNVIVRTNTTIGTFNFEYLDDIIHNLIEFKPKIINFLPVNEFDLEDYNNYNKLINYIVDLKKFRIKIKQIIDVLSIYLPNTNIYIKYMPFCDMIGYEKHILNYILLAYDTYDWNIELGGLNILNYIKNPNESLIKLGAFGSTVYNTLCEYRKYNCIKTNSCIKCKYFLLCDGVKKTPDNHLILYIKPNINNYITDVLFYM